MIPLMEWYRTHPDDIFLLEVTMSPPPPRLFRWCAWCAWCPMVRMSAHGAPRPAQVSMGAIAGQLTNINKDGATSMMWHAMPYIMDFDPHSGDYGPSFAYSLPVRSFHTRRDRVASLKTCCLHGAAIQKSLTARARPSPDLAVWLE